MVGNDKRPIGTRMADFASRPAARPQPQDDEPDFVAHVMGHPSNAGLRPVNMDKPVDIEDAFKARLEDSIAPAPVPPVDVGRMPSIDRPPVKTDLPPDHNWQTPPVDVVDVGKAPLPPGYGPIERVPENAEDLTDAQLRQNIPQPTEPPRQRTFEFDRQGKRLSRGPQVAGSIGDAERSNRVDEYVSRGMSRHEARIRVMREMSTGVFDEVDKRAAERRANIAAGKAQSGDRPDPEQNPTPVYDRLGRPSLVGRPQAPAAKVSGIDGTNEFVEFGPFSDFRRKQLAKNIIRQHQIGPDASGYLLDPRTGTLEYLRALQEKLRADKSARRESAFADRIANEHIGRDLMTGQPRALGMIMRSNVRAAEEGKPLVMAAINQGLGNNVAAGQNAAVAMTQNQIAGQDRRHAAGMAMLGAQMQQQAEQAERSTPQGLAAQGLAARQKILSQPPELRLPAMQSYYEQVEGMSADEAKKAALEASAVVEAQKGNVHHPHVAEVLRNKSRDDMVAWLMQNVRHSDGRPLSQPEAMTRANQYLSAVYRGLTGVYDAFNSR